MAQRKQARASASAATTGYEVKRWKMADALRGLMDIVEYKYGNPEEYRAESIFWMPPEARWGRLKANAMHPGVGRLVDDSMLRRRFVLLQVSAKHRGHLSTGRAN